LIEVDESTRRFLDDRLDLMRPAMVRHFGVPLTGREGLSIVRYPAGGFFRRHRDRASVPSWPAAARRRIAVVVFLSSSRAADAEGAFSGGALRLFRERSSDSTDIHPRMGMLVAFPASTAHEVTVVEGGVRDVLVDWYH
jgi:predicted 2-oxoglutarate/Fe(II)-dependent dioxygenase YbiX